MEIGIGLPNTIPGVDGKAIAEWARRADAAGFSTLGVIDRLVYANVEPLVTLSVAAAVTERIRLTTAILIAPYRENAAVLAKQAASLHALSEGRLTLGMAVGGRDDDYAAAGVPTNQRGRRFDEMLAEVKEIWSGAEKGFAGGIGPDVSADPPRIVIGGGADAAYRRAAANDGWIMGGGPPDAFSPAKEKLPGRLERRRPRRRAVHRRAGLLRPRPERRRGRAAQHRRLLRLAGRVRPGSGRRRRQGRAGRARARAGVHRSRCRRADPVPLLGRP